jgi:hypothetical protein
MQEKKDEIIDLLKELNFKLNLILGEIVKTKNDGFAIKDMVKYLHEIGLDSKNVSQILGITSSHASKEISGLKKGKKGEKDGKKVAK